MSTLLDGLNPSQREAVMHTNGPLLIIAGPGSGKTRTVAHSIAYAIEKRVQPDRILAFSFTVKASQELKKRVAELGKERGALVEVSTFHSFCRKVLREDLGKLDKNDTLNFQDLDEDEQEREDQSRVAQAINYLQYHDFLKPEDILNFIIKCKTLGIQPSQAETHEQNPKYAEVYAKYEECLKAEGRIDYSDQLRFTDELFTDVPEVKRKWQEKFELIFVDEYQDTDPVQYRIIKALAERHQNLRVVGDDDQGIYGWRGADIQNILNFEEDYPKTKADNVISLGQNYRSTPQIIAASNALVEFIPDRRDKELFTWNLEGKKVKHFHCENAEVEAHAIADFIYRATQKGRSPNDFAVLYRTKRQAGAFKTAFQNLEIQYSSDMNVTGVSLMTIHKAKGMEFLNVFVVGICKDLLPHYHNRAEKDWDEELRLLYVAMTRAQNWLCLSSYEVKGQYPRGKSPFLDYIPDSLLESVKTFKNIPIPPPPKEMESKILEKPSEYVEPLPEELLGSGMTVMGIDPGNIGAETTNMGWSITQKSPHGYSAYFGTKNPKGTPKEKLGQIAQKVNALIAAHSPNAIAVEKLEVSSTQETIEDWFRHVAVCVAAIKSIAAQHGIECSLYTPQHVKYAATGNRRASKMDVQRSVMRMCNLPKIPEPHHSADAIAVSLCYLRSYLNSARFEGNQRKQEAYKNGLAGIENGQYETAVIAFKEAINIDPLYADAHCGIGRAYLAQGNLEEAENSVKEALRLDANYQLATTYLGDIKQAHVNKGLAYIENKEYAKAMDPLLKASNIDPDDKKVWTSLGRVYYCIDDYASAISCYRKAIDIDPNDKTAYTNLGNAYYWMGKYEMAVNPFRKAKNIDSDCAKTRYYLARVYFQLRELEKAEQEIIGLESTYQPIRELSGKLKKIKQTIPIGMILIPSGKFQINSNDKNDSNLKDFYIDKYRVTNAQYLKFLDANPQWCKDCIDGKFPNSNYLKNWNGNNYIDGKGDCSVVYVSWYAARAYAEWIGKRLPTEIEWEKAVGTSNMWEWCFDPYNDLYLDVDYRHQTHISSEKFRVLRIDSSRGKLRPWETNYNIGFRCAQSVIP